ncbi:helix-turn-helix transcriptional regulator [Nocardiopsis sp. EMB25]|uniref:helix-turn-helix domain-containing protein n=1 Tax=Nocardiopsis sp. EMB25 TaxID=2835867 RepID=UPI002283FDF6|nr:helix-turn-helix transcriptional regulator [Nocardiopsis sp. EMB25]MCY9786099.1 helix-turn-helix transcriptional regulator [Nocardiopsis sp. EMB25]
MPRKPNPSYRKIATELRKLRKSKGWTQGRLAEQLSCSTSLISYWELAIYVPQLKECQSLDQIFGTSGFFERAWGRVNSESIYPVGTQTAVDFERSAADIREYHTILVPGLAQTPGYARATYRAMQPFATEETLDRLVASRVKRHEILRGVDRPLLWMVLDEGVIRRVLGSQATMKEQLEHLLEMTESRTLRLQIVPRRCKLPPGISGPFKIYTFPDRPMVVTAEYVVDDLVIDDTEQVRYCANLFGAIQSEALSTSDSYELVRRVQGELDEQS